MTRQWDEAFIRDTVRQLCCGLECYVFDIETARYIQKLYKKKTKLMVNIKREPYGYILLKPIKKYYKNISY